MSQYDEERLRRIACSARDTYFNEEQAGKLPNLALIIRDALLEYGRTLAPERTESAAEQSEKSVQAPSGGQPQETAPAADLLPGLERAAEIVLSFPNMPNGRENSLLNMIVTEIHVEISRLKEIKS